VRGLNIVTPTGDLVFVGNGVATIPARERLTPAPFTARSEPQFVWDMAARRLEIRALDGGGNRVSTSSRVENDRATDAIQVAVFVRRVDGSIRFGSRGAAWAFTRPPTDPEARVPVAADAEGRPTLDGRGTASANRYSTIQRIEATVSADPDSDSDALTVIVPDQGSELIAYARQVGQRFVTRAGTVHVVRSLRTNAAGRIEGLNIEPPIRSLELTNENADFGNVELLFTPQIPAAVSVFTIQQ
jgi:hypothetical protein